MTLLILLYLPWSLLLAYWLGKRLADRATDYPRIGE